MSYISKHFKIEELVSPQVLQVLGEAAAWRLFPQGTLSDLDNLRTRHGYPITINGAGNTQCGVRAINCTIGAKLSRHKLVDPKIVALDLHSPQLKALLKLIVDCHGDFGICKIENPTRCPGWIHCEFYDGITLPEFVIFEP